MMGQVSAAPILKTEPPLSPDDIVSNGHIVHPRYREIYSRIGFGVSLYFFDGWTPAKREALQSIRSDYLAVFPGGLTHVHTTGKTRVPITPKRLEQAAANFESMDENTLFYFCLQQIDLQAENDPRECFLLAFGNEKNSPTRKMSGIRIHLPVQFALSDPQRTGRLVADWAGRLGAAHGTAGLAALLAGGVTTGGDALHFEALRQYPCLDFDAMGSYWSELNFAPGPNKGYDKLRASNWLTFVGDMFVAKLGGAGALRAKLSPDIPVLPYAGGLCLQAGPAPELGDAKRGYIPEAYRTVARAIRPVRFEDYKYGVFDVPEGIDDHAVMLAWLKRFD
jgi:hypothetical protein